MSNKPVRAASNTPTKATSDNDKRKLEIIQLQTRYKKSFRLVSDDNNETVVRIAIKPSDPDFPYEIEALQVQLKIPKDYPKSPCTCLILNTDIPKGFAINLEKGYSARVDPSNSTAHLTLVRQMNWLDRNMEALLQQAPAATVRFVSHRSNKEDDRGSNSAAPDQVNPATAVMPQQPTRQFMDASSKPVPEPTSEKSTTADSAQTKPVAESSNSSQSTPTTSNHSNTKPSKPKSTPPAVKAEPKYAKNELDAAEKKRKFEFRQIETRFCDYIKILRTNARETVVSLVLEINDPEFTHEQMIGGKHLTIKYHIPAVYPLEPCTIEVDNKSLDKTRASWITSGFNEHVAHGSYTLFENLNWLNRNIELLISTVPMEKTEEQVEADTMAAQQVKESRPPQKGQKLSINAPEFSPKKETKKKTLFDEEDDSRKNNVIFVNDPTLINEQAAEEDIEVELAKEEDVAVEEEAKDKTVVGLSQPVIRKGTEIRLLSPKLENVSLFRCTTLHLIVKCARCKDTVEVENIKPEQQDNSTERWTTCPTCSSILGVKFLGELIHQGATTVGLLQFAGCKLYDVLPSTYIGTCGSCMADMNSPMKLSPHDSPRTVHCFSCHGKMTIGLGEYSFVKIGTEGGEKLRATDQQVLKLKKKKKSREDTLTIGEPLPDQGTCSHYRKSKRWFRFSCCHKLYPCDVCHDSHEDHVYEWAKKQVCGLCSRESSIHQGKPCVCGNEFDKTPLKGAFWEGGKGVRNKTMMSRKDPHKHKGTEKTTSKKQERVGVAGKERHQHKDDSS